MQKPTEECPFDLLDQSQTKLITINSLLCAQDGSTTVNLLNTTISDGIYYLLDGIAKDIGRAASRLKFTKEVA